MEALTSALTSINWEPIFQLTFVGLILVRDVVIFLLAFRGGDL